MSRILEAEFKHLSLRNERKQMSEENKFIFSFQEAGLYRKKIKKYLEEQLFRSKYRQEYNSETA